MGFQMGLQEKLLKCQSAGHQVAVPSAKIKKVGNQRVAPETMGSRTYHHGCCTGMKNQGSESQDQKVIASHYLQSRTSASENSMIP